MLVGPQSFVLALGPKMSETRDGPNSWSWQQVILLIIIQTQHEIGLLTYSMVQSPS